VEDRNPHIIEYLPEFVLGCLEEAEARRVADHLAGCESCRGEFYAYQELAGQIGSSIEQIEPPASLKKTLLAQVVEQHPGSTRLESRDSWVQRWIGRFRPVSRGWGAISLGLIMLLALSNLLIWQRLEGLRSTQANQLRTIPLHGTESMPGATGLVIMSLDGRWGTVVIDDLAVLGDDQEYQLWLIRNGDRDSGGLIAVNPEGYGWLYVHSEESLASYTSFGITIEPRGGSSSPTGTKVLGGEQ
jgi:anti-sigma-K factor RskA